VPEGVNTADIGVDNIWDVRHDAPMSRRASTAENAPRLSRERILDAAIRIADRDGADAVTLRRLGAELGVDPTAAYRHFRDKEDLLVQMCDRLLQDLAATIEPTGRWREDIVAVSNGARGVYLAHPQLAYMLATSPGPLPNSQRLTEILLASLRSTGLPDAEIALAYQAIENYTVGASSIDAMATPDFDRAWARSFAAAPDRFPEQALVLANGGPDHDQAFRFGIDALLDAVERSITKHRGGKETP
jgi:AcrR family transcriptional regulator